MNKPKTEIKKFEKLADICRKNKIKTWESMNDYARKFSKYDNWTYRDIDKAFSILQNE